MFVIIIGCARIGPLLLRIVSGPKREPNSLKLEQKQQEENGGGFTS